MRLDDDAWQKLRAEVLARDQNRCTACGDSVAEDRAHIHHVMPRALGGRDELANLTTLCSGCHAAKHPLLQVRLSRRIIQRWAWRLAQWLDHDLKRIGDIGEQLGAALRLFDLDRFRDGQLEIVLAALSGKSLLMVSPTGSGKSLCFQLPAVFAPQVSLVVSPLKALMTDQVSGLQRRKIPATFINSDLDPHEKKQRYQLLEKNAFKLLYCAPERFDRSVVRPEEVARLERLRPRFMVVDEAHCVDKWGDDFRPSYSELGDVAKRLGSPAVLAFTATATIRTQRRIVASLGIDDAQIFVRNVDRPNIAFVRLSVPGEAEKIPHLIALLRVARKGRAMIFVPTIKIGQSVTDALKSAGIEAPFYHAKLRPSDREFLLKRFVGEIEPPLDAIVCTNAFGMGLDVPNVRLVIHWQHPASIEDYLQEFGRAGRDGRQSLALLFRTADDRGLSHFMIERTLAGARISEEDRDQIRANKLASLDDMHELSRSQGRCFRRAIVRHFESDVRKRIPIARKLLAWAFSERARRPKTRFCCDVCAKLDANVDRLRWAQRVLG
jgi:RecQ family ATP-dependent DNA helicase